MTNYERWTIYPLLLLILGILLKDKLLQAVDARTVNAQMVDAQNLVCRNLRVVDADGRTMVQMGVTEGRAGALEILGASGKPIVVLAPDDEGKRGMILTKTDDGHPLVDVYASDNTGQVRVHDENGRVVGGLPAPVLMIPVRPSVNPPVAPGKQGKANPPAGRQPDKDAPPGKQTQASQTDKKPSEKQ